MTSRVAEVISLNLLTKLGAKANRVRRPSMAPAPKKSKVVSE